MVGASRLRVKFNNQGYTIENCQKLIVQNLYLNHVPSAATRIKPSLRQSVHRVE